MKAKVSVSAKQQPGRAVNSFIEKGEFVAMKMLSGHKASRCDKEQFRDKISVSTWIIFEISLLNVVVLTRKKTKNGTFATAHFGV